MLESLLDRATKAMDSAILWQLGTLSIPPPDYVDFPATDIEGFWDRARLESPPPVAETAYIRTRQHGEVEVVDLEAPSRGPGTHPGASQLIARAHLQRRRDAPVVIVLHGFAVPAAWYEEAECRVLTKLGASAVRLDHPWHLRRRARGLRSGEGYMTADPRRLLASARQSVEDAAALVAWARSFSSHVAVVGTSLGGLTACLLASQIELDSVVAVAPFCDPAYTLVANLPASVRRKLGITPATFGPWGPDRGHALEILGDALKPIVVRNLGAPRTPPERIALVCPSNDLIVGPAPITDLAHQWGCALWDLRHSHISILNAPGLQSRINRWLLHPAASDPARVEMVI